MTILSLYLSEVVIRTKEKHQLSGLAERYLGNKGKIVMFLAQIISIYGALAAYIIGSGQALSSIFGGSSTLFSILFFVLVSFVVYFSINIIEEFESLFTPLKIAVALILSIILLKFINFNNFSGFSYSNILIPYGVSIFAFTGLSAIPEMNEELRNKKYIFWAIIFGMIISFLLYLLFTFTVVGSLGAVDEVATVSLSNVGSNINLFANLFALLSMSTAFVVLGFALKENLTLDFKISNSVSWMIVVAVPLFISLSGFFGFVKLLELVGSFAIGIILFMVLLMHSKAKTMGNRKPEYSLKDNWLVKSLFLLVLVVGLFYSILINFI